MEVITGHIREHIEYITGEIKEYCDQEPVLVKDSSGAILYTKNPGETATVTDSLIKDSTGSTLHSVKAEQQQTIADVIVKNSENTVLATIKAEAAPTTLPDITVTKGDGSTVSYPASKDYAEAPNEAFIYTLFPTTYDLTYTHTITADEAGTYDNETLVNVATVAYEINSVAASMPLTLAAGDTFKRTITQTNAALDSSVKISY